MLRLIQRREWVGKRLVQRASRGRPTSFMPMDSTTGADCGETALVIPVLWLCGPPGVGKTSVAWRIRARLRQGGVAAAYVDIDQLGMCYPERECDPGRHRLKARN